MKKFTDQFIKLPIKSWNSNEEDITGKRKLVMSSAMVRLEKISYWYQATSDAEGDKCICVQLGDENAINVYLPMSEFEKRLNDFAATTFIS